MGAMLTHTVMTVAILSLESTCQYNVGRVEGGF
jgi:hypothetical protein